MILIQTFILLITFLSCQEQKAIAKTINKPKITKIVSAIKVVSNFVGNYSGTDVVTCGWYTARKNLFLVNLHTQQATPTIYYAEQDRMMLTINDTKRVFQRLE